MPELENTREHALTASASELADLVQRSTHAESLALLDNPACAETHVVALLQRKDLLPDLLEEISQRKMLLKCYPIKRALAYHPLTPRLVSVRLLRDLYLMDLVQLTCLPGVSLELKRAAENQIKTRLPQLPLGQKITLARRGPAAVAGILLAEGHEKILAVVLDNACLNETQILKAFSRENLSPAVVQAIAQHEKWSHYYNIRLALVRNPGATLSNVLSYLPDLTISDLRDLAAPGIVPERLQKYLQAEVQRRLRAAEKLTT